MGKVVIFLRIRWGKISYPEEMSHCEKEQDHGLVFGASGS